MPVRQLHLPWLSAIGLLRALNTADLHAVIAENRQLHAQNVALKADIAALESYADKLEIWGKTMKARADALSG